MSTQNLPNFGSRYGWCAAWIREEVCKHIRDTLVITKYVAHAQNLWLMPKIKDFHLLVTDALEFVFNLPPGVEEL